LATIQHSFSKEGQILPNIPLFWAHSKYLFVDPFFFTKFTQTLHKFGMFGLTLVGGTGLVPHILSPWE